MRTGLSVGDIMTQNPVSVPRNVSVRTAAQLMKNKAVGSLLVVEEEELLGILTKSDVINKVVADANDASEMSVGEIMTSAVYTIQPEKDVFDALVLMKNKEVRHLPVLSKDTLVGFVTVKDVVKVNPDLFEIIAENIDLREEERKLAQYPYDRL